MSDATDEALEARAKEIFKQSAAVKNAVAAGSGPARLAEMARIAASSSKGGGKVIFCGNGGSGADAQHIRAPSPSKMRYNKQSFLRFDHSKEAAMKRSLSNFNKAPRSVRFALVAAAFVVCLPILHGSLDAAQPIGTVAKQRLDAYGTPPGGDRDRKFPRYDVVYGERIETTGGSAILIRLSDGSELYLGERADLTLDEFVYDPASKQGQAVYKFSLGTLRFVSGTMDSIGITIQTPNTNIGIRGSDAVIFVTPEGETFVNVSEGQFSVRSRERPDTPAALVAAGQNVSVRGVGDFSPIGTGIKFPEYSEDPAALVPDYSEDYDYLKSDGGFDTAREGSRDPGGRAPGDHSDPGGHHDAPD